jgi:DNA topoisomerase-2
MNNEEIKSIVTILGLQYGKKYIDASDLRELRYGKVLMIANQDQAGSHIKGLVINLFHHNWPHLLRHGFLQEFITPIVKVTKGKEEIPFYSVPEFEKWKAQTDNAHTWKVKYYKGLGTSTSYEAKEYFSNMDLHRIPFVYEGTDDDEAIELAFSKKCVNKRKIWLMKWLKKRKEKRRRESYLYGERTDSITYSDFINKELILYSIMDNKRSIPSLVDGFKPGQRKVIYTCFKRNDKKDVKVVQLASSVAEQSAYHHGETNLTATIINLAQNFVGSNNVNVLQPIGQFGTRLHGGKDAASPRYIFTQLSPLARMLFPSADDPILKYLYDDNLRIEPEWYCPILPMVLVNGAEGIGTGYATNIPNFDPREIVANLKRLINEEEPVGMKPHYKNFQGTIDPVGPQKYAVYGRVGLLSETSFEITELPIKTWTQNYKENVLELMLHGTEKSPPFIT